ncbi:hypothetical protein QUF54_08300 [Candidatus Marithioploca araucensis]|uniref:Uncharacterized protein n=1 Tax=Candidatus Marithioploca araucensis TaxID=70273 RepID=A0ABT7VUT5_9GAMM|nr:hypothetical protein [Candidatus Marithioploca araucensis]
MVGKKKTLPTLQKKHDIKLRSHPIKDIGLLDMKPNNPSHQSVYSPDPLY